MKHTYKVIDSAGATHLVQADTMVSDGPRVVFWAESGGELGSFLHAIAATVLPSSTDSPGPAEPCCAAGVVDLIPGEVVSFDGPPRIEIGVINITAGSAEPRTMLEEMRAQLPKGTRGECLDAVLHFVGELVNQPGGYTPESDIHALRRLKSAVDRMQFVARSHQQQ